MEIQKGNWYYAPYGFRTVLGRCVAKIKNGCCGKELRDGTSFNISKGMGSALGSYGMLLRVKSRPKDLPHGFG